jgi:heterotetrameric sarcosine oxidase gamma subunit
MRDPDLHLIPTAPFEGLSAALGAKRGGVTVCDRDGLGIAHISARRGAAAVLAQRLQQQCGIELPRGPHRMTAGDLALHGVGPGTWLATSERGGNAFVAQIGRLLGDSASVCDVSDGYAVLRLGGPHVRETLCKLVPVDVQESAFRVGNVAVTVAAHIGVTLWRREDDAQGRAVFELAVFRSLAKSFWEVLSESAAEFGMAAGGPSVVP